MAINFVRQIYAEKVEFGAENMQGKLVMINTFYSMTLKVIFLFVFVVKKIMSAGI